VLDVLIYGVGSTLVGDLEESLARSGHRVAAAVRNVDAPVHLLDPGLLVEAIAEEHLRLPFLVALFTPAHRQAAAREASERGLDTPFVLVDASVPHSPSLRCEAGVWVNAGCSLGASVVLAEFALVNRGASLGHHTRLGRFASIGPGAVLAGHVTVGDGAVVAAGATVLPERTVGANAVVGAGAVVTDHVAPGTLVVGNPARPVRTLPGYAGLAVA
jgi:UDP-3-O-[3-hydroxymyristoyl] glucosamine N-acyltransferase